MRRIGGHVATAGGLLNAIKNTESIGGSAIQIFAGSPRIWARSHFAPDIAKSFRDTVAAKNLNPVYIHALYLTNLASDNPDLVAKSKKALIMDMTNSAAIGSAGVVLHIGSHQGRGWASAKGQVIEVIQEVLDVTLPESILLLENSAGQNGKIGSFSELADIHNAIKSPRLRMCLDTAHAFESGYDFTNDEGLEKWIADIEGSIGLDHVELLHLNDSKTPCASGRDMHENIGDGFIGTEGIRRIINHHKLAHLPLILEVPGRDKMGPDKENIDRVKNLIS